jgi:hypothetical protein
VDLGGEHDATKHVGAVGVVGVDIRIVHLLEYIRTRRLKYCSLVLSPSTYYLPTCTTPSSHSTLTILISKHHKPKHTSIRCFYISSPFNQTAHVHPTHINKSISFPPSPSSIAKEETIKHINTRPVTPVIVKVYTRSKADIDTSTVHILIEIS